MEIGIKMSTKLTRNVHLCTTYIQSSMWVFIDNNLPFESQFFHVGFGTKGKKVRLKNVVAS